MMLKIVKARYVELFRCSKNSNTWYWSQSYAVAKQSWNTAQVRARDWGSHGSVIGPRGSRSLRVGVDTKIQVDDQVSFRMATCNKQSDMKNGTQVASTLRGVDLGLNYEHDLITSCGVQHAVVDFLSLKKSQSLKGNILVAKQAQDAVVVQHVFTMADTENYTTSRRVVSVDVWRAKFSKKRLKSVIK